MTERLDMPEISAAAFNAQANQGKIDKPEPKPEQQTIMIACTRCEKFYNKSKVDKLCKELPELSADNDENICLTCSKELCQQMKASYHPDVVKSKSRLAKLTRIYQKAHNDHKALEAKYKKYDYLANMITHHLTKPVAKPKSKAKPQTALSAAQKALDALSEDQRALILAAMGK